MKNGKKWLCFNLSIFFSVSKAAACALSSWGEGRSTRAELWHQQGLWGTRAIFNSPDEMSYLHFSHMALCVREPQLIKKKAACAGLDMAAFNPSDPLFPWMPEFCHEIDSACLISGSCRFQGLRRTQKGLDNQPISQTESSDKDFLNMFFWRVSHRQYPESKAPRT